MLPRKDSLHTAPLAHDRAEDPVDEPGSVGAAVLLGDLDRLVDRDLGRHVGVLDLIQRHPHHVEVERRQAVDRPALRVGLDLVVELFAEVVDALGDLAGQRTRLGDQLLERPAGDVALIAGEDRVAALVGPTHGRRTRRCGCRSGRPRPPR